MTSENEFLLHALAMGVYITFLYDILRIFRRVFPHGGFLISLEDLCFWIYCGGEVFLLMYHESDGTLRWFAVLGAVVGMFLYKKLVSPWFVGYVSLALRKVVEWMLKFLCWIGRPLVFVGGKAKAGAGKMGCCIGCLFRRLGRNLKNRLTYFLKMLKIVVKTK